MPWLHKKRSPTPAQQQLAQTTQQATHPHPLQAPEAQQVLQQATPAQPPPLLQAITALAQTVV